MSILSAMETPIQKNRGVSVQKNRGVSARKIITKKSFFFTPLILRKTYKLAGFQGDTNYNSKNLLDLNEEGLNESGDMLSGSHPRKEKKEKLENIVKSIDEFHGLENNWDGYGAIPLSLGSAKNAKEFIRNLPNELFENFYDGFPNTHGTISFEWKNKNNEEFFIEIGETKMSYFLTLDNQKPIKKDLVEFNTENIKTIKSYIQKLNASI
jgi:hypothetical protein